MAENVTASSDVTAPATIEAAPLWVVVAAVVLAVVPVVAVVVPDAVVVAAVVVVVPADERATSASRQNTITNVVLIFASFPLMTI
jgi:hypothetical protein